MSWYGVDYACGHSDRMQVYGPVRNRQAIADQEGRKDCPACYRQKQDEINARKTADATAAAAISGLPELLGSSKQVAWAMTIRQNAQANIALAVARYQEAVDTNKLMSTPLTVPSLEDFVNFAQRVMRQTEAKYWIDRRQEFGTATDTQKYLFRRASEEVAKAAGAAILKGGAR